MKSRNYVMDSIEAVLSWDISDDALPDVIAMHSRFLVCEPSD